LVFATRDGDGLVLVHILHILITVVLWLREQLGRWRWQIAASLAFHNLDIYCLRIALKYQLSNMVHLYPRLAFLHCFTLGMKEKIQQQEKKVQALI